jgi:hypothetical protein
MSYVITSITALHIGLSVMLVIMSVSTFITAVILYLLQITGMLSLSQVFSLLRVRFRSVSLYFKIKATISWPNFYIEISMATTHQNSK